MSERKAREESEKMDEDSVTDIAVPTTSRVERSPTRNPSGRIGKKLKRGSDGTEKIGLELKVETEDESHWVESERVNPLEVMNELLCSSINVLEWKEKVSRFEYEGFDPMITFATMMRCSETRAIFKEDFSLLVSLILMRGTNLPSIQKKMKESGKEDLIRLVAKYLIKQRATDQHTITLGRIAIVASPVIASILKFEIGRFVVSPAEFGRDFPVALAFPSALSIIPNNDEWSLTIRFCKLWNNLFSKVIKSKTSPAEQENFFRIQLENTFFPEHYRISLMKTLEISPMLSFPSRSELGVSVKQMMGIMDSFMVQ
ncbi:Uncharacterised protein g4152 [Pycnogonum litorale]